VNPEKKNIHVRERERERKKKKEGVCISDGERDEGGEKESEPPIAARLRADIFGRGVYSLLSFPFFFFSFLFFFVLFVFD